MSKAGETKTTTSVPDYVEKAGKKAMGAADRIEDIGYTPYYGPDVAAFAPQQMAAFQNTNDMAQAFGMDGGQVNMPQAQDFNGVQAYSSAPMYEAALGQIQQKSPEQFGALQPKVLGGERRQQSAPPPSPFAGKKGGRNSQQIVTGPDGQQYTMQPMDGSRGR